MLTLEQLEEHSPLIEIDAGSDTWSVAFAPNGEYIISGGQGGLGVWRVEDGEQMASMGARRACSVAVSKDGRWIAAGTLNGEAIVWDAKTFKQVFSHKQHGDVLGVDFSPDSTRIVTASRNQTATVWDVAARNKVLTLHHTGVVVAAKYSPQGDRIATATLGSTVRVYDSNNGCLLVEIPVNVTPWYNTGLLWSNNHLFAISHSTIKKFEASTGSAVTEWPVPVLNNILCVALPQHGKFIAYGTNDTVTFCDMWARTQLGLIQHPQDISLIVSSPDDRFLAIIGRNGRVTIRSRITVSIVFLWIILDVNNFLVPLVFPIGFNPSVSSTSHSSRT